MSWYFHNPEDEPGHLHSCENLEAQIRKVTFRSPICMRKSVQIAGLIPVAFLGVLIKERDSFCFSCKVTQATLLLSVCRNSVVAQERH
jgi:hypothetical protein